MRNAVAEVKPRAQTASAAGPAVRVALLSFSLWAGLIILVFGVRNAYETQKELRLLPYLAYDQRVDFAYFYAAADMVRHGDASELYPKHLEYTFYPLDPLFGQIDDEYVKARLLARGNYYNPPIVAYLEAPFSAMPFRPAFWTFSALSGLAILAFAGLAWRAGRAVPEMAVIVAGLLAFRPVHEAIMMGHLSLFFCLALGGGFLAVRAGRPVVAGLSLSLLAMKPQWGVLPAAYLVFEGGDWGALARTVLRSPRDPPRAAVALLRGLASSVEGRALAVMVLAGAVLFLVPFLAAGAGAFKDYLQFLRDSAAIDVKNAPHMFSWNGFLSKLITGDPLKGPVAAPNAPLLYGLQAMTVVLMLIVWMRRDFCLGVAATVIAMLLVSTRSVWYDWALVTVAAVFLALRHYGPNLRIQVWAVLLALFVSSSQSVGAVFAPDGRHGNEHWITQAFFSVTLVAFAALVWMGAVVVWEWRRAGMVDKRLEITG